MDETIEAAERVLIGACLNKSAEQVWTRGIDPTMFDPGPRQRIAATLYVDWTDGVVTETHDIGLRAGEPIETFECHAAYYHGMGLDSSIHVIREANEARLLRASSARIVQMLDAGVDSEMVKERLLKDVSALPSEGAMGSYNLDQVLGMEDVEKRWVIPGVLAQRERLMLTGNEGSGKSMLLAQIALGAAYGLNPFQPEQVFEPQRVLVLDVENDHEAQLAVNWRKMNAAMRLRAQEVNPNVVLAAARDIDFYNPVEANEFVRLCVRTKPNLVVMGSLYKLTSSSEEFERFARTVQSIVDKIRARTGAAVIIEAHAGHGFQGNRNNGRPDGSSLWLRWPELGIWMKPWRKHDENPHRVHRMERWRGDRTVRDGIPYGIEMGGTMPWNAIPEDEFQARYGD